MANVAVDVFVETKAWWIFRWAKIRYRNAFSKWSNKNSSLYNARDELSNEMEILLKSPWINFCLIQPPAMAIFIQQSSHHCVHLSKGDNPSTNPFTLVLSTPIRADTELSRSNNRQRENAEDAFVPKSPAITRTTPTSRVRAESSELSMKLFSSFCYPRLPRWELLQAESFSIKTRRRL